MSSPPFPDVYVFLEVFTPYYSRNGYVMGAYQWVAMVTPSQAKFGRPCHLSEYVRLVVDSDSGSNDSLSFVAVKVRAHELRPKGKEELLSQVCCLSCRSAHSLFMRPSPELLVDVL